MKDPIMYFPPCESRLWAYIYGLKGGLVSTDEWRIDHNKVQRN
jgi:hypothetical protein